jgi:hypothetical protein
VYILELWMRLALPTGAGMVLIGEEDSGLFYSPLLHSPVVSMGFHSGIKSEKPNRVHFYH